MTTAAAPARPAAPPCPSCGGALHGSRLLHEDGDGVFRVSRCKDCHLIIRRHYALRFVRQEQVCR